MYIAKTTFKFENTITQKGDEFVAKDKDGKALDDKMIGQLLAEGLIVDKDAMDADGLADLEKKIAARKAELADLDAEYVEKSQAMKTKSQSKDKQVSDKK